MKKIILVCFTIILVWGCGHDKTKPKQVMLTETKQYQDSLKYRTETIEFINQLAGHALDSAYIMRDTNFDNLCLDNMLTDSLIFSKEERAYLQQKKYPILKNWTNDFFPNSKLSDNDSTWLNHRDDYYFLAFLFF